MNTEERRAKWRAYYHKNSDVYRVTARERAREHRAKRRETPEQAAERRRLIREWYAKNAEERRAWQRAYSAKKRGDVPMPDVWSVQLLTLLIGLLAQRNRERLAKRREWQHAKYGSRERKMALPKPIKVKRPLMTIEEKLAKGAAQSRKWRATHPNCSWVEIATITPEAQSKLREQRRNARKRWLTKMKATDPSRYAEYKKRQTLKTLADRKSSPQRRFACALRTKVYVAIRRQQSGQKTANTITLTGCTIVELMAHLERQFQPGMTWQTFGRGDGKWSMDHIRPLASFNLTDAVQQREAFHWSNISPKWCFDNTSKNSFWNGRRWLHSDHSACVPHPPA